MIARPAADEYDPYYDTYISKVPAGDVLQLLHTQLHENARFLEKLTDEQGAYRYAPGKWSLRQVVGHVTDAERVFSYRMLCIARGETAPLPGFDENRYAEVSNADTRPLRSVVTEFAHVRSATISLVESLNLEALTRVGNANGKPITPRALVYIIAGHERHHMGVVRERYVK